MAYSGPAFAANRVIVSLGGAGVRIAFAEEHPDAGTHFRTAVILAVQDAIKLKDLLTKMLADVEKQIEKAETAAKEVLAAAQDDG